MFENRQHGAEMLAEKLAFYKNRKNTIVAGLPRGGVVTAYAVAKKLNLPLCAIPVKKIKHPFQNELAAGAAAPANSVFYNKDLAANISPKDLADQLLQAEKELKEYEKKFCPKPIELSGKTVILTDDGIATGSTVSAAILFLKKKRAAKIILASPVAAADTIDKLKSSVDEVIVLEQPVDFMAVGQFYKEFEQVEDEEVLRLLKLKT